MEGYIIHIIIVIFQSSCFPLRECGHVHKRASAGNQFDRRINKLHGFGSFLCHTAILMHRFLSQLPLSVHFISQTPEFDVIWIFYSMFDTQIAVFCSWGMIAVFQKITGICRSSCSQVHSHHYVCPCFLCPSGKFSQTECIGFQASPCQIQSGFSFRQRSYTVFPEKVGYKVSAGITNYRYIKILYQLQYILTESVFVCSCMIRLINAAIYCSSQMFDKRTVDSFIYFGDAKSLINNHFCIFHSQSSCLSVNHYISVCFIATII